MGEQARLITLPDGTEVWARLSPATLPAGDAEYADAGYADAAADAGGGTGGAGDHGNGGYGDAGYEDDGGYGDYEDVGALDHAAARVLRLRELITGVAASVRDAAERAAPDEVSVEFGVEFAVKSGAVVSVLADAESSSGLKVTLTWRDRFAHARPPAPASAAHPAPPTVPPPAGAADA
jgi:hypothetical protein